MRTIFSVFKTYDQAQAAVKQLVDQGFDLNDMNVVVQQETVKSESNINEKIAPIAVTGKIGDVEYHGLDRMMGGKIPVLIPGIGEVLASGTLADILVRTASQPDEVDGGLTAALRVIDVPKQAAMDYAQSVLSGNILFFLRTADERTSEAVAVLNREHAQYVTSVAPNGKEM